MTYDLDPGLQSPESYSHDLYSHAKVQGQRSIGSEDRVETNGRTDGCDRITSLANAVGKYSLFNPIRGLTSSDHGEVI